MNEQLEEPYTYSAEQREAMLEKMQQASHAFYYAATRIGNHAFIEFCGLMNEYIKLCHEAHEQGIDFTLLNVHSGRPLPMKPHHADYIGEKLGCIFGAALADPAIGTVFLQSVGILPEAPQPSVLREDFDTVTSVRETEALRIIGQYGAIDGDHHKTWVIDQVAKALLGTNYAAWVVEQKAGEDGPNTYDWNEGIPP
jgi:hypothetical protein